MKRVLAFFGSMTGRIFLILEIGIVGATLIATGINSATSSRQFAKQLLERTADRLELDIDLLDAIPAARAYARDMFGSGVRIQDASAQGQGVDADFQAVLAKRQGLLSKATVEFASGNVCHPELYGASPEYTQYAEQFLQSPDVQKAMQPIFQRWARKSASTPTLTSPPTCRLVNLKLSDGADYRLSVDSPMIERERSRLFEPIFLALLVAAVSALAYIVARIASAPLFRLSRAATELGQDLDRAPVTVSGPTEVREAAEAFNAMQSRLQENLSERTQMLAAITHDLQTPITRLRLRLERIDDEPLRDRLVTDLGAMSELIDEGLDLARSAETSEPLVMLDLDSLLGSLVEDATDAGAHAVFEFGCHTVMRLRPLVVRRLFANLIDNALKYGGAALVSAVRLGNEVSVRIRDRGPGLPTDMLERVFDPFVRVETSRSRDSGGTGLGLTIARKLAETSGATLTLHNGPDGGLEAVVRWVNVSSL